MPTGFQGTFHEAGNAGRLAQLVLPNADDFPPLATQLPAHISVPFTIGGDLGIPVFLVAARTLVALWATVPKAAIYKNNNPLALKGEIRFA